jgi:PiT family inorganic phosphate transporter
MLDPAVLIILVVLAALLFDFTNGWNDSANAIATVVSTRVLSPLKAVLLAAFFNFLGAYLSTAVAKTIGGGIVDPQAVSQTVVLAAMLAAAGWTALMTVMGMPISASHALIGGLIGSAIFAQGMAVLKMKGVLTILIALFVSPILGLVIGFLLMISLMRIFQRTSPALVNKWFGTLQVVSASFMALSHGTNDAQKVMGVITLALVSGGFLPTMEVPFWVITVCATAMALGTAVGGWRVIRTLGLRLSHIQPVHGFAAETAATAVLMGTAGLGIPVSTTHVITSAVMGVGATKRLSAVRWGIGKKIVYAWIFTLPACILLAGILYLGLQALLQAG